MKLWALFARLGMKLDIETCYYQIALIVCNIIYNVSNCVYPWSNIIRIFIIMYESSCLGSSQKHYISNCSNDHEIPPEVQYNYSYSHSYCSSNDDKTNIYQPLSKLNMERPVDLSENNSTSMNKGFCNGKKSGTGSVNSDNDSGCALDEYSWVPSGLLPEQVWR